MATPTPAATTASFITVGQGPALGTAPGNVAQLHWHRTNNTQAEVETAGYYNNVALAGMVKVGDLIISTYDEDGTPGVTIYHVTAGDGVTDVTLTQNDLS